MSAIESATNVFVGYWLAVAMQFIAFPLFGLEPRLDSAMGIGAIFTAVSLIRSYGLRRLFERWRR